jgi:hypothetical protein
MTSVGATKATASPTRPVQGQRKRLLVGARGACRMATTSPTCVAASPQHAHGACCLPFLDAHDMPTCTPCLGSPWAMVVQTEVSCTANGG